jgi:hypothetical protein
MLCSALALQAARPAIQKRRRKLARRRSADEPISFRSVVPVQAAAAAAAAAAELARRRSPDEPISFRSVVPVQVAAAAAAAAAAAGEGAQPRPRTRSAKRRAGEAVCEAGSGEGPSAADSAHYQTRARKAASRPATRRRCTAEASSQRA